MKLYKFRPLRCETHLDRIMEILKEGFYCSDFLSFNDMNEGVFTVTPRNCHINLSDKLKYKICSFSGEKALKSQLMWGHYANAGMGVAIEVEVYGENVEKIKPVNYGTSEDNFDSIEKILMNKAEVWSYEDEYRYLTEDQDETVKIAEVGKIVKIHFGTPYKELENYCEIKEKHRNLKKFLTLKAMLIEKAEQLGISTQDYKF